MSWGSECVQGASVEGSECARRTILEEQQAAEGLSVQGDAQANGVRVEGEQVCKGSEHRGRTSVQGRVGTNTWKQVCKGTRVQKETDLRGTKLPKGASVEGEHECATCVGGRRAKGGGVGRAARERVCEGKRCGTSVQSERTKG